MKQTEEKFKVGDEVHFWTMAKEGKPSGKGKIYRGARQMCGSTVYWVENLSGCIAETHLEKIQEIQIDQAD